MNNIRNIKDAADLRSRNSVDTGGQPPDDGGMNERYVTHVEFQEAVSSINERFARVETRLDQTATKADLAEMKFDVAKWIVVTAIAVSATFITIMTFVLNNATPKTATPAAQPPIIINVPSAAVPDQSGRAQTKPPK